MNERNRWDEKQGRHLAADPAADRDLTQTSADRPKEGRTFNAEHYAEGGFVPQQPDGAYVDPAASRGWWSKAKDEVGAMLGDKNAEQRRQQDHARDEEKLAGGGDWEGHDDDTGWRDPVSPGKEAEVDHGSQPTEKRE